MMFPDKRKKLLLEIFVSGVVGQIELQEKQYDFTRCFYRYQFNKEKTELEAEHIIESKKFEEEYDRIYEANEHLDTDPEEYITRHEYAYQVSGLEYFDFECDYVEENLKHKFSSFFHLYSESIITSHYSLIESNLKDLCELLANELDKKIKPSNIAGKNYIQASLDYLNLVIDVDTSQIERLISKLRDIQYIRNQIVHSRGIFKDDSSKKNLEQKYQYQLEFIESYHLGVQTYKLRIQKPEFILDMFQTTRELFEKLTWLIDEKQNYKVMEERLTYLLQHRDDSFLVKNVIAHHDNSNKKTIAFYVFSTKDNTSIFKYTLSLKKSSKNLLIIEEASAEHMQKYYKKAMEDIVFDSVFDIFNIRNKKFTIKVKIEPCENN